MTKAETRADNRRLRVGPRRGSARFGSPALSQGRSNIRLALILVGVAFVFYFGIMAVQAS